MRRKHTLFCGAPAIFLKISWPNAATNWPMSRKIALARQTDALVDVASRADAPASGSAPRRRLETDLYAPIKMFLEAQGYEVKGELRGCDVVARRGEEPPVIVELKTAFGLPLLLQGVARLSMTDAVYLAFPDDGAGAWRRRRREATALCRRLGLGVLLISFRPTRPPLVEPALDPGPYAPRKNARRAGLLLREFERRRGDPTPGGGAGRPIMTAYRQDALACAAYLAANGPSQPKTVRDAGGVARAAVILQRDVYGWFLRVERGVYTLSDKGQAALRDPAGAGLSE